MKTIDSIILSKFIIDKLDVVSHLKVQKLLYYINAWHMVYFNDPIIEDDFEAWVHGPVSRKVYSNLKDTSLLHKKMRISDVKKGKYIERVERTLEKEQIELLNDVLDEYGNKSDYHLEQLTHLEKPWQIARQDKTSESHCSDIILKKDMRDYYSSKLRKSITLITSVTGFTKISTCIF